MTKTVLFLCPHSAAKSVIAASYFESMAAKAGLDFRANNAGTDPDPEIWPSVIALLAREGLAPTATSPNRLHQNDLDGASRIVSLGCDIGQFETSVQVEHWDDVPQASDDLVASAKAIRAHVQVLIAALQ